MPFLDRTPAASPRTRIKLCGFTREADVDAASALDIDAMGFVFYRPSPRYVAPDRAAALARRLPDAITPVALFVDASEDEIEAVLEVLPSAVLQFHGEEPEAFCAGFDRPWIKAARVMPGLDLLEFVRSHSRAAALMLDAHSAGYGGAGQVFEWSLVPDRLIGANAEPRVILSGGLHAGNVADAIACIGPFAVDTSSGIESPAGPRGVKDLVAMRDFVAAVRETDSSSRRT